MCCVTNMLKVRYETVGSNDLCSLCDRLKATFSFVKAIPTEYYM